MTDWSNPTLADYLAGPPKPYGLAERSGGHFWTEGIHGRVCQVCNRRWAEVVGATKDDLRQPHYAHSGNLIDREQEEFAAEVDWLWSTIVDAASAGKA